MDENIINEIKDLNNIHTTWRDYALMLLNSTPNPLRGIWREKLVTSIIHAEFVYNSVFESHMAGIEIMSELPNDFTDMVVDDHYEWGSWKSNGRLVGSKRKQICIGHYPQESIDNEALKCLKYIIKHFDKYGYLIFKSEHLKRIWDFSQRSNGNCVYPDEVLTYNLERELKETFAWIEVAEDIFENGIPSDKFKRYYFSEKIEGFPFKTNPDIKIQKKNFLSVVSKILKEDILSCPSWKKICICILKNDISFKYAGFGISLKERQVREEAIAAFSINQKEREKAKIEAEKLAVQIKNKL